MARNPTKTRTDKERTDVAFRPAPVAASSYNTQDDDLLIAEPGKGAAWIQVDPTAAVNARDMR